MMRSCGCSSAVYTCAGSTAHTRAHHIVLVLGDRRACSECTRGMASARVASPSAAAAAAQCRHECSARARAVRASGAPESWRASRTAAAR
jgi:hypothetical protein